MTLPRRTLGRWALAGIASSWPLATRAASAWPTRPVRLIVAYPPGGISDGVARVLAEQLQPLLGVPVRVENRAGAGGSVAIDVLARAVPDGHTLAFSATSPLTLHPLIAQLDDHPERNRVPPVIPQVVPVCSVVRTPVLVVGTPAFTGSSLDALLDQARQQPGALRWATSGQATVGHLVLVQVRIQSGTDITHVPYHGGGQQLNDALGGQFEVLSTNLAAPQLQHVARGRFKALAVGAPNRLAALPAVPTLAELGLPQANLASLFGIYAPAHTPAPVLERLNTATNLALRSDSLRDHLRSGYNLPAGGSAADFQREIDQDRLRNQALVRSSRALFH